VSRESARDILAAQALGDSQPGLVVAARRIAANVAFGAHGRRRPGTGESFWQFRRYESGDPARSIDWRRSARAHTLYVREREWAVAATVRLWCDTSASMDYASNDALPTKSGRATLLLLALASLLLRGGERVALLGQAGAALTGQFALPQLAERLTEAARQAGDGDSTDGHAPPPIGLPIASALPAATESVLIGDFLDDMTEIESRVAIFAAMGVRGHLLQVLDPAEVLLPFSGRTRFKGLENEGTLLVGRAEALQEPYRRRMAARSEGLTHLARRHGWTHALHRTDQRPETALLALTMALTST